MQACLASNSIATTEAGAGADERAEGDAEADAEADGETDGETDAETAIAAVEADAIAVAAADAVADATIDTKAGVAAAPMTDAVASETTAKVYFVDSHSAQDQRAVLGVSRAVRIGVMVLHWSAPSKT